MLEMPFPGGRGAAGEGSHGESQCQAHPSWLEGAGAQAGRPLRPPPAPEPRCASSPSRGATSFMGKGAHI